MILIKDKEIVRGNIYWVNLDPTIGSEIKKTRPAIVISNNMQNRVSSRIVVIPLTSSVNNVFPFEAKILVKDKTAKALADQIRTIDKSRIGNFISKLSKAEVSDIERAIKITLSLD